MDLDEDGIISSYELSYFWEEQEERYANDYTQDKKNKQTDTFFRQRLYGICESEMIYFDDVICQM
jgi:hypothetical protein